VQFGIGIGRFHARRTPKTGSKARENAMDFAIGISRFSAREKPESDSKLHPRFRCSLVSV
jgi:hypothetical protein